MVGYQVRGFFIDWILEMITHSTVIFRVYLRYIYKK